VALKVATGCHVIASEDHIHRETMVVPLKPHAELLSKQFFLGCHRDNHPCSYLTTPAQRPRRMKNSLHSRFNRTIQPLIPSRPLLQADFKQGLRALHTATVDDAVRGYSRSITLGGYPPPVNIKEEICLPRIVRCRLSQLRLGHCVLLADYRSRIDPESSNICPDCNVAPQTVVHLFSCPANPTELEPIDLWLKPRKVAAFLGLLDDDPGRLLV
jgi:hypothetical protein